MNIEARLQAIESQLSELNPDTSIEVIIHGGRGEPAFLGRYFIEPGEPARWVAEAEYQEYSSKGTL